MRIRTKERTIIISRDTKKSEERGKTKRENVWYHNDPMATHTSHRRKQEMKEWNLSGRHERSSYDHHDDGPTETRTKRVAREKEEERRREAGIEQNEIRKTRILGIFLEFTRMNQWKERERERSSMRYAAAEGNQNERDE